MPSSSTRGVSSYLRSTYLRSTALRSTAFGSTASRSTARTCPICSSGSTARTYPICSSVSRIRRAVGRASPVAPATAASDMAGWPGWNARITSRPRARASMKSGLVSRRAMGASPLLRVRSACWVVRWAVLPAGRGRPADCALPRLHDCSVTAPRCPHGGHGQYAYHARRGRNCYLTPAARPANVPVKLQMAALRTHVRNSAATCSRPAEFIGAHWVLAAQGLCRTGVCSSGTAAQWR